MICPVTDADECAVNNGGCSPDAYCTNTPGNFTCTCIGGYFGDGFNCEGKDALVNSYCIDILSCLLHPVLFCDGTSRYGVPENLRTG